MKYKNSSAVWASWGGNFNDCDDFPLWHANWFADDHYDAISD